MSETSRSQVYYDDFASTYEDQRHHGYHQLLDELELDVVQRFRRPGPILEAGCGTGLILARLGPGAVGIDLSPGMLQRAQARGLRVVQGSVDALPFADASFDTVVSFKVLAHVPRIREALAEMARVTRPGGRLILEFYNRNSLRGVVKRLKRPTPISAQHHDGDVYTRLDSLAQIRGYLPEALSLHTVRGVRVFTPVAQLHDVPLLGAALGRAERLATQTALLSRLGGFLVVVLDRR